MAVASFASIAISVPLVIASAGAATPLLEASVGMAVSGFNIGFHSANLIDLVESGHGKEVLKGAIITGSIAMTFTG